MMTLPPVVGDSPAKQLAHDMLYVVVDRHMDRSAVDGGNGNCATLADFLPVLVLDTFEKAVGAAQIPLGELLDASVAPDHVLAGHIAHYLRENPSLRIVALGKRLYSTAAVYGLVCAQVNGGLVKGLAYDDVSALLALASYLAVDRSEIHSGQFGDSLCRAALVLALFDRCRRIHKDLVSRAVDRNRHFLPVVDDSPRRRKPSLDSGLVAHGT